MYATFDPLREGEPAVPEALQAAPDAPYGLLQFVGPVQKAWVEDLLANGLVFYDYVPQYAYIVRLPSGQREAIAAHPAVRWLGPLHPAYKVSPTLTAGRIVLSLFPDADIDDALMAVKEVGAQILKRNEDAHLLVVSAEEALFAPLAGIPAVQWLQNDAPLQEFNDDARWVSQGGLLNETPLYEHGLTGAGQVGAVADSGLAVYDFLKNDDPLYEAAPSCYFLDDGNQGAGGEPLRPNPTHRKVVAYVEPPGAEGDQIDSTGHGSHVVGSIVGDRPPWGQPSQADGQAYDARVFFQDIGVGLTIPQDPFFGAINPPEDYRVLFGQAYDPDGDGLYRPELEPRTHSNSWGSTDPIYSVESAQTDEFMWTHPDFLILFAAGNQGPGPASIGYPATAKNVVTVGATENGMADPDNMAYFSSHGPSPLPEGRLKPTVSAPGDRIASALRGDPCGVVEKSGTSMATPTVHGIALLMRQYLWDGYHPTGQPNPGDSRHPSAALLKALLMNSGRAMDGNHTDNLGGGTWPSNGQGWGRVTADDVLYLQGDHRALWLQDEVAPDGSAGFDAAGQRRTYTLTVGDGHPFRQEPLEVTLTWSDYPGTPLAGGLVNDLNLTVVGPDGNLHVGNDLESNDFRGSGVLPPAAPDDVNPWEVVYLEQPLSGTYTVTVTVANMGSLALDGRRKQGFALVASGDLHSRQGRAQIEFPFYEVNPREVARLRISDLDLNGDANRVEQVQARVTSSSEPQGVTVTLRETAADSGVFSGQVSLSRDGGAPKDLAVATGDEIRLAYRDGDDGRGQGVTTYDTARVGRRPLNFVNPAVLAQPQNGDGDGRYTLSWQPPEETEGLISYVIQETTIYTRPLWDNAEGDLAQKWQSGQLTAPWRQDVQYAQSGITAYWSGRGDTGALIDSALTLKEAVTLPSGSTSASLGFYSRYFNDLNDNGYIEISDDGGQTWHPLRRLYADPRVVPPDTRLQYHQLDLTPYLGQALLLRFRYSNGVISFAPDSPGWWLDDIRISSGTWQTIATVAPDVTSYDLTGRAPGHYYYRLRAVYEDGSANAWSEVRGVSVDTASSITARATGGGWLERSARKINFGFRVASSEAGLSGKLQLNDNVSGAKVEITEVTHVGHSGECDAASAAESSLSFSGSGTYNGQSANFRVCLGDNGQPGRGSDTFRLACLSGCAYDTGSEVLLGGGNVQVAGEETGSTDAPQAQTAILQPLLMSEALPGQILILEVAVYDQNQDVLPGAPVTLTYTTAGAVVESLSGVSDRSGIASFTVMAIDRPAEYVASAGDVQSNSIHVTPLLR